MRADPEALMFAWGRPLADNRRLPLVCFQPLKDIAYSDETRAWIMIKIDPLANPDIDLNGLARLPIVRFFLMSVIGLVIEIRPLSPA